jgi:hypothetical protein
VNDQPLLDLGEIPRRGVPRDKAALRAFMRANVILTWSTGEPDEKETPKWVAVKVPPKNLANGKPIPPEMTIGAMFASFGRLLDEGGWTGYGATEREAVEAVCAERKIPFNP